MNSLAINDSLSKDSRYSLVNFVPSDDEDSSFEFDSTRADIENILVNSAQVVVKCHKGLVSTSAHSNVLEQSTRCSEFLAESEKSGTRSKKRRCSYTNDSIAILPNRVALSAIQDFQETSLVLRKDPDCNELGISVSGGSDTYLEAVVITEVHQDSVAYKDGRLRKGDVILAVNDISFRDIPASDAVRVLKESSSPLKLMILRENPQTLFTTSQIMTMTSSIPTEGPTKFITVELRKTSIKDKLGISLIQRTNGRGVFITYTQPGSLASRHGDQIMQGDQLLEVNAINVRESNQKDVAQLINGLDGAIVLLLGRLPSQTANIQEWSRKKSHLQHWRARTCTWSSYTANSGKEKVQSQRPSLPISNESSATYYGPVSPVDDVETIGFANLFTMGSTISGLDNEDCAGVSRSSSIRSRIRLSIVVEGDGDSKQLPDSPEEDIDPDVNLSYTSHGRSLVPSIQVTEF
ncbi:Multiple PDZ domain protein [Halotydeus destructor]|nr:Multiple PDZ domain protein [Halotydeus destructor]